MTERKRCFIAIEFPENIKREIKKIQNKLPYFDGKRTEQENLHLTLKFLGGIDDEGIEEVKERLRGIKLRKFTIKMNMIGVFSRKFIRIIWLGVDETCRELWKLQQEIDRKLKDLFEREERFMGHVTIGRVKNVGDKRKFLQELEKLKINFEFEVDSFKLKESALKKEGPEYKDLEIFELD